MIFSGKKALSQQLSSTIKKKWCKECTEILDQLVDRNPTENFDYVIDKDYPLQNANSVVLNRMKERVEALEELNDHLHYYIYFLIENLPDLIIKTIQSGSGINETLDIINCQYQVNRFESLSQKTKCIVPIPTRRENEVLDLLEKGYGAKEIAARLFISETTVITHKKNLKKKFDAKNTVELISKIRDRNHP